ncbi:hypothetical protein [Endozoicomonas sp. GU-1]|uniref:hypothetical protein n=1 Tax=Endozoicomonas sp. GU-1 TaxID=3009078 RepID=UPI0022B50023|nr:hypothetical protein [Endozoicomonas sp. GU-1]WBA83406.1 hypothetical protein O2T12_09910 [Endozoicomonas sp. GU-1]
MFEKFINMTTPDEHDSIRGAVVYTIVTLLSTRAPPGNSMLSGRNESGPGQTGLAGFGIPCCQTHLIDNLRLRQTLWQRILIFEPRLDWVTVHVDYGQNLLSFFIEGALLDRYQQNIQFRVSYPCHLHIS